MLRTLFCILPLFTIFRRQTAEWLLDALEVYLHGAPGGGGEGIPHAGALSEESKFKASPPPSWPVASLLLEGMAAAVVFHHEVRRC